MRRSNLSFIVRPATAAAILVGGSGSLEAQAVTSLGHLTCSIGAMEKPGAEGASEARQLICSFRPSEAGIEEHYTGTLHTLGELAPTNKPGSMMWVVRGPAMSKVGPGLLEQTFTLQGGQPETSATPLVSDGKPSIALYPLSGANPTAEQARMVAAVATMDLKLKAAIG